MPMTDEVRQIIEPIKDLTTAEITTKIKSGDVQLPKGKDREELLRLISMDPDARTKEIPEPQAPIEDPVPPKGPNGQDPIPPKGPNIDDPIPPKPPETPPEPKDDKPWYSTLGYEDQEKAIEAHKNLQSLTSQLKDRLDKANAAGGKKGTQLKALTAEVERLTAEVEEWKNKAMPPLEKPEKPTFETIEWPDASKFEDRELDSGYIAQLAKCNQLVAEQNQQLNQYYDRMEEYNREDFNRKMEKIESKKQNPPEPPEPQDEDDGEWDALWNKVGEFQRDYSCQTTVPVKTINDTVNRANAGDADAKRYLQTIPKEDIITFERIRGVVEKAYVFTDNGRGGKTPVAKYNKLRTVLEDYDIKDFKATANPSELTPEEDRELREKEKLKQQQSVEPIPGDRIPQGDKKLEPGMTFEEKSKRYNDLITEYTVALNAGTNRQFEESPKYAEMQELRVALGMRAAPKVR